MRETDCFSAHFTQPFFVKACAYCHPTLFDFDPFTLITSKSERTKARHNYLKEILSEKTIEARASIYMARVIYMSKSKKWKTYALLFSTY
jgi:hypothetical protein